MSDHNENKIRIFLLSLLPPVLLLGAETALFFSLPHLNRFIAYFAFAVLSAQLVLQVVFIKGEICNGQRFRLVNAALYLALYWVGLLLLGALAEKRYIPLMLLIVSGLLTLFAVWQQPKEDERLQRALLLFANVCALLGVLAYLAIWWNLPRAEWLSYSPFSQLFLAVVLANWLLRVSRNRLQGLLQLLPRLMLLTLLLNAVYSVIVLLLLYFNLITVITPLSGFILYFVVHLLAAAMLGGSISKNNPLRLPHLAVLLILALSFPFWLT
ncbi:hypothetical protein ACWA5Z_09625 [Testudinibacter sp. P80/BLE/0925]|uniref:hypothetical protein n=1 Tax=Testudinibacter sp. TW-1 TaxID=3417757 RepID=UPI003D36F146